MKNTDVIKSFLEEEERHTQKRTYCNKVTGRCEEGCTLQSKKENDTTMLLCNYTTIIATIEKTEHTTKLYIDYTFYSATTTKIQNELIKQTVNNTNYIIVIVAETTERETEGKKLLNYYMQEHLKEI